jgi:hypothetical protein
MLTARMSPKEWFFRRTHNTDLDPGKGGEERKRGRYSSMAPVLARVPDVGELGSRVPFATAQNFKNIHILQGFLFVDSKITK